MTDTPTPDLPVVAAKPIALPQICFQYLRQLVNSTQWATTLFNIKFGGEAFELLPEPEVEPIQKQFPTADDVRAHRAATKAWAQEPLNVVLNSKHRKAVRACLEFYYPKGALPPGSYTDALLAAFGIKYVIKEEDDNEEV